MSVKQDDQRRSFQRQLHQNHFTELINQDLQNQLCIYFIVLLISIKTLHTNDIYNDLHSIIVKK